MGGNIISDESEARHADVEVWRNMRLLTCQRDATAIIDQAAILVKNGRVVFAGAEKDLPAEAQAATSHDLEGRLVTPSLIDCHTHLVYGGNRAREFEMRLEGASYEDVARAGGGIVSSVKATNALSEDELIAQSLPRLDTLLAEGISTIEIKSGYGLNIEAELKMLRVARRLATMRPVRIYTQLSWLPMRCRLNIVAAPMIIFLRSCYPGLEAAHAEKLVDAVDGFCEGIAFSPDADRPCV